MWAFVQQTKGSYGVVDQGIHVVLIAIDQHIWNTIKVHVV